jgi:hypothetical protein
MTSYGDTTDKVLAAYNRGRKDGLDKGRGVGFAGLLNLIFDRGRSKISDTRIGGTGRTALIETEEVQIARRKRLQSLGGTLGRERQWKMRYRRERDHYKDITHIAMASANTAIKQLETVEKEIKKLKKGIK